MLLECLGIKEKCFTSYLWFVYSRLNLKRKTPSKPPVASSKNQYHHRVSELLLSCVLEPYNSTNSFFGKNICLKYLIHLFPVYGIIYNSVASRFFVHTSWVIRRTVRIWEVADRFLRKPFWFFLRTFSTSGQIRFRYRTL